MPARKEKVLAIIYQNTMRERLRILDSSLINPKYGLQIIYRGSSRVTYSCLVPSKDKTSVVYRIVIGGATISSVLHLPDKFHDKVTLKPYIAPIKAIMAALNYHEMSHVMISDLTFAGFKDCDPKYDGLAKKLYNICEDPIVDKFIVEYIERERPHDVSPRTYMKYLHKLSFYDRLTEYKDDGSLGSFMQYLLLLVRCGRKSIPNTNAVFEKYAANLVPMLKAILSETNGTQRQVLSVELAKWIYENIEEFNWDEVEAPDDMKIPSPKVAAGAPSGCSSGSSGAEDGPTTVGKKIADTLGEAGPTTGKAEGADSTTEEGEGGDGDDDDDDGKGGGGDDEEGEGDGESEEEESEEEESEEDEEEEDGEEEDEEADEEEDEEEEDEEEEEDDASDSPEDVETPDVDDFDDCFEDLLNSSYSHEFVIAKDTYVIKDPDALEAALNKQLEQSRECIDNVSKFLTLFKGRIKPRRTGGFHSGRLDVRAAMQDEARGGGSLRLFERTLPRGRMTDLAVSLVCDNSGSMIGTKSRLASIAALALAQACEWSKVPFECSCFTKTCDSPSGTSVTIIEKSFDDPFEKVKPYFAVNDSNLIGMLEETIGVPTFCGNSEEVNLYHITTNLAKCGHKTKLMLVFCDGATTGSVNSLRGALKRAKDLGIHVIGVGLMSSLRGIYEHYKNFDTYDEMRDGLAQFLVDTLSEFALR